MVPHKHTVGVKSDGSVLAVGANDYGQCNVENWVGIIEIAAGTYHTVGIRSDGTVLSTGRNSAGQLVDIWDLDYLYEAFVKGDINDDGEVDLADALLALQVMSGMNPAETVHNTADTDGNGKIDMNDALYAIQKSALLR